MPARFDHFAIFAEMRTGSNLLEESLNAFSGIECLGEVFNPHFVGYPKRQELYGITFAAREANPFALLELVKRRAEGLPGFRIFHDHDARIVAQCLSDERCAKIVLSRNPLDSYISLKIARSTGQWKLSDARHQRAARIRFDEEEFAAHIDAIQGFQRQIVRALQISGQTAFFLDYEDVSDLAVVNGIAAFLGIDERKQSLAATIVKQNPEPPEEKVANFSHMQDALARMDRFNASGHPNFEPRRGPAVPGFRAAAESGLLFMPVRGGPVARVVDWLHRLDGAEPLGGFTQKTLRQWKRQHPGNRGFAVLRHPAARAHAAFCAHILSGGFAEIRATLEGAYKIGLPPPGDWSGYGITEHREAFLEFLAFLKANLAGQTGLRVDGAWASQASVIQGFAQFALPDILVREDELAPSLAQLAAHVSRPSPPLADEVPDAPHALDAIYDAKVESAVRDAYQRDYMQFGFADWRT